MFQQQQQHSAFGVPQTFKAPVVQLSPVDELVKKFNELETKVLAPSKFKSYDGAEEKGCEVFLDQFRIERLSWTEKLYFAHIRSNLAGKAMKWYDGAINNIFRTPEEFEKEFREMFGVEQLSGASRAILYLKSCTFELGKLEIVLIDLFSIGQKVIALSVILEVLAVNIPETEGNKLKRCNTWKEAMIEAKNIDKRYKISENKQ